jgi:hypothetical protein
VGKGVLRAWEWTIPGCWIDACLFCLVFIYSILELLDPTAMERRPQIEQRGRTG